MNALLLWKISGNRVVGTKCFVPEDLLNCPSTYSRSTSDCDSDINVPQEEAI